MMLSRAFELAQRPTPMIETLMNSICCLKVGFCVEKVKVR